MAVTSDPLGIDLAVTSDLDPNFRLCHGSENLSNALCRRLNCSPGALESVGDDPDYGYNLPDQLGLEVTDNAILAAINASVRNEMVKDPRAQSLTTQAIAATGSLYLNVSGESSEGPFDFVAEVSDMTVDRLKEGMPSAVPATQGEVVGATVTVVSQTGADGPAGPAGAPGGGGGAGGVEPDLDGLYSCDVAAETLLKQVLADFTDLPSATASCAFSAYIRALGGATGTFRLRVGGTDGVADGTLVATLTVTSTSYQMLTATGSITKPVGVALVKLTAQSSTTGLDAQIKSAVAIFT